MHAESSKRVGIWIRVSTEDQVRGESPEHHERRARHYAEAKGWDVIEVYRLDAISGKTVKETAEAKRMLGDIKKGHITGIIFSKLARLARNTRELLEFAEEFRTYNADLISLGESIDTSTPAGRLFYTMIAAMAQWEREEIAQRVAASVPIRAKMGKPLGGQAPFGYQWKDRKLIPDLKEAPVRKLMYELFREYRRKKTVARLLNERGYRTRNGSLFSDTTVDRLLRDPTAKGIRRANYTQTKNNKKTWERKPESEWVLLEVEAIVPEELWNECNAILDGQRAKGKRLARQTVHLFAGLTHCGCGQKMYVPSNTPKYVCYACRNKIPVVDLEGVFHEQIKNFFFSPHEIAAHLSKAHAAIHEKEELLTVLHKEQKKLAAEVDKLYDLYQSSAIDKAGFGAKYHPMALRQRQLEEELPQVQAELDVLKISHLSQEEIVTSARDLYTRWPTLPNEEKRQIVEAITERIIVHVGEVEIHLFYAPPASVTSTETPFTPETPDTPPTLLDGGGMATKPHRRVAFLPYVRVCLKALKPKETEIMPQTLGEHIHKRRKEMKLNQREAGKLLGVSSATVLNWEKTKTEPPIASMPAIFRFLGYDPFPKPESLPERLLAKRRAMGWSLKEAARHLGVDEGTWRVWESGETVPRGRWRELMNGFLGVDIF
ncbi:MAG: recombinase family protein [Patescibacteria group bacterium]